MSWLHYLGVLLPFWLPFHPLLAFWITTAGVHEYTCDPMKSYNLSLFMGTSHKAHSVGQHCSCPYFKSCKKHSIRYVAMGRVMQCSQTQLERSPLPGGSGLAGLRRMPPGPQSAAGQQWHHPAAGNRNRKSLKHGNAQLTQETTTLCWRGWILKFIYAALGTYGTWFNKSKNRILANLCIILVSFNIPNKSVTKNVRGHFTEIKISASLL